MGAKNVAKEQFQQRWVEDREKELYFVVIISFS